jgi:hypothetical protein
MNKALSDDLTAFLTQFLVFVDFSKSSSTKGALSDSSWIL